MNILYTILYRVVIEQVLLMQMFVSVKIRFKMPSKVLVRIFKRQLLIWCASDILWDY